MDDLVDDIIIYKILLSIEKSPLLMKDIIERLHALVRLKGLSALSNSLKTAKNNNLITFNEKDKLFCLTSKGRSKLLLLSKIYEERYIENREILTSSNSSCCIPHTPPTTQGAYPLRRQSYEKNKAIEIKRSINGFNIIDLVDGKRFEAGKIFRKLAREEKNLCDLSNMFESGGTPDYSSELVQSFYVLKYYPAYLAEYLDLYNRLKDLLRRDHYEILSVGSGCGTDYDALRFSDIADRANWEGIDVIEWQYKSECKISKSDFFKYAPYCGKNNKEYNVIFFPRSADEMIKDEKNFMQTLFSIPLIEKGNCAYVFAFANVAKRKIVIDAMPKNRNIKIEEVNPYYGSIDFYTHNYPFPAEKYKEEFKIVRNSCNNIRKCNKQCRLNYPVTTQRYRYALIVLR